MKKYENWLMVGMGLLAAVFGTSVLLRTVHTISHSRFRYPGSVITKLFDYHFFGFVTTSIVSSLIFGIICIAIADAYHTKNPKASNQLVRATVITGIPASLTIGMIACLTPEQFGIVTGVISFLALFSFIIQQAFKDFIHELRIPDRKRNESNADADKHDRS